jgi:hypothetical protein
MSTAAILLDIEKASDTTWHSGLLYGMSELGFSASLVKVIAFILTNRKFNVFIEGEFSTRREIAAVVPQGFVLTPVLYSLYTNDASAEVGTHLALFADDTSTYLYMRQRSMNVVFSANCNAASLQ